MKLLLVLSFGGVPEKVIGFNFPIELCGKATSTSAWNLLGRPELAGIVGVNHSTLVLQLLASNYALNWLYYNPWPSLMSLLTSRPSFYILYLHWSPQHFLNTPDISCGFCLPPVPFSIPLSLLFIHIPIQISLPSSSKTTQTS